jgi:NAD(P)-dependent dehydrogenase (short-subunit alcohol dehydrogenase family)
MIAETLRLTGRIDALVNNAGVADFGPIADHDLARWRTVMETNLDGVFLVSQAAIPASAKPAAPSSTSPRSAACAPRRCAPPTAPRRPR